MWIEFKDLASMAFEAESRLCDIDAQEAATYHLAYEKLLEVFREANNCLKGDANGAE